MSWEYRVFEIPTTEEHFFRIHEVYYDEDDNIEGWSKDPINPFGCGSLEDLKRDLELMQKALELPVIKEWKLESGQPRLLNE